MEPDPRAPITLRPWAHNEPPPLALTTHDVAKALRVGESHVRTLIRSGALQSVKIGKSRRVTRRQLDAYLKRLETE